MKRDRARRVWHLPVWWDAVRPDDPVLPPAEPQVTVIHVHHHYWGPPALEIEVTRLPQPRRAVTTGTEG